MPPLSDVVVPSLSDVVVPPACNEREMRKEDGSCIPCDDYMVLTDNNCVLPSCEANEIVTVTGVCEACIIPGFNPDTTGRSCVEEGSDLPTFDLPLDAVPLTDVPTVDDVPPVTDVPVPDMPLIDTIP